MDDERPSEVIGALPHSRPHRRSQKRPRTPATAPTGGPPRAPRAPSATAPDSVAGDRAATQPSDKPRRLHHPVQPDGLPPSPSTRKPVPPTGAEIFATAVQATAELAEIGLTVSARALRNAVSRLTRPS